MAIKWRQAHSNNWGRPGQYGAGVKRRNKAIVWHITGGTGSSALNTFLNGANRVSPDLMALENSSDPVQMVPDDSFAFTQGVDFTAASTITPYPHWFDRSQDVSYNVVGGRDRDRRHVRECAADAGARLPPVAGRDSSRRSRASRLGRPAQYQSLDLALGSDDHAGRSRLLRRKPVRDPV